MVGGAYANLVEKSRVTAQTSVSHRVAITANGGVSGMIALYTAVLPRHGPLDNRQSCDAVEAHATVYIELE